MTDPPDAWWRYVVEPGGWVDVKGFTPPEVMATATSTHSGGGAVCASRVVRKFSSTSRPPKNTGAHLPPAAAPTPSLTPRGGGASAVCDRMRS